MSQTNYSEMRTKLVNLEAFQGNSVSAVWDGEVYKVYSYSTLMYSWDRPAMQSYFNNKYYSVTTSKIQNILIDVYNINGGSHKRD